mgnify:CR=1 FL=1
MVRAFEHSLTRAVEDVSQKINKAFRQPLYIDTKEVVGYEESEGADNYRQDDLFHEVLLGLDYNGKFLLFQSYINKLIYIYKSHYSDHFLTT